MKIEVEVPAPPVVRAGTSIAVALVGNPEGQMTRAEIRVVGNNPVYWLDEEQVPAQLYRDVIMTLSACRWEAEMQVEEPSKEEVAANAD